MRRDKHMRAPVCIWLGVSAIAAAIVQWSLYASAAYREGSLSMQDDVIELEIWDRDPTLSDPLSPAFVILRQVEPGLYEGLRQDDQTVYRINLGLPSIWMLRKQ
jgi:hypothetical protein